MSKEKNHKLESIRKLMEIAKSMEKEDAQAFKKKKLQPEVKPEAGPEGAE